MKYQASIDEKSSLQKIHIKGIIVSGNLHYVILGGKIDSGKDCQFVPNHLVTNGKS